MECDALVAVNCVNWIRFRCRSQNILISIKHSLGIC